ncbi:MAG: DUF3237 family protein [Bacteroidaceae bacterium]|nr:DUF3237 family protein [Bacteroidaceae bacterium]
MTEILTILITILGAIGVNNGDKNVNMIAFSGRAESSWFSGDVMSGGIDTQTFTKDGGHLSARYILQGKDNAGDSCKIYIENNGKFGEEYTTPTVVTDSKSLAFLNKAKLRGKLDFSGGKLTIRIYKEDEE